jgi:hypothetical protein
MINLPIMRVPEEFQLEPSLVEQARRLTRIPFTADVYGRKTCIWYRDNLAFKRPHIYPTNNLRRAYIKEALVKHDLQPQGINVVPIHGIDFGETLDDPPIIVMERLARASGIYYTDVPQGVHEDYERQMDQIKRAGYYPKDTAKDHNCGIGYDGKVYFFDFEQWHVPSHIEDKIQSCWK